MATILANLKGKSTMESAKWSSIMATSSSDPGKITFLKVTVTFSSGTKGEAFLANFRKAFSTATDNSKTKKPKASSIEVSGKME